MYIDVDHRRQGSVVSIRLKPWHFTEIINETLNLPSHLQQPQNHNQCITREGVLHVGNSDDCLQPEEQFSNTCGLQMLGPLLWYGECHVQASAVQIATLALYSSCLHTCTNWGQTQTQQISPLAHFVSL